MKTQPYRAARKPYPAWTYPARAAWLLVQGTLWRLAWRRIFFLRPMLLRLFGATLPSRCQIGGSVRVYFPWLLAIGADVSISHGVVFYNLGGITIGHRVVI